MKTVLISLTAALLLAKLALTAANEALWPLSPYNMFSHPLHQGGSLLMLEAEHADGSKGVYYPWNLMPMDIYRSSRLLGSGEERRPVILSAVRRYANERRSQPGWRTGPPAKEIRSLKVVELPLSSLMNDYARRRYAPNDGKTTKAQRHEGNE